MLKSDKYVKAAFVAKSIHYPYHIASLFGVLFAQYIWQQSGNFAPPTPLYLSP